MLYKQSDANKFKIRKEKEIVPTIQLKIKSEVVSLCTSGKFHVTISKNICTSYFELLQYTFQFLTAG